MWNLGRSLIPSFRGDYTTLTNFPVELKSALLAIGVPLICSASTRFPQLLDRNYTWLNFLISEAQHAAVVAIGQGKKVYNFTCSKIGNVIFRYEGTSRMAAQLMAICDKPPVSVEAQDMVDEKGNPNSSEGSLAMVTGYGLNTTARLLNSLFPERMEKKTLYTILETDSSLIAAFLEPVQILEFALTNKDVRGKLIHDDGKWIMPSIDISFSNCDIITRHISFRAVETVRLWTRRGFDAIHPHLIEKKCSKLMNLSLRGCAFDEADFEDLTVIRSSLPNLQSFNYEKNSLEDKQFMALLDVVPVAVHKLCLRYNRLLMHPDVVELDSLFTVEVLNLKNNLIRCEGLTTIVGLMAMRRLLKLNLGSQTPKLTDEAVAILSPALKDSVLTHLLLTGNSITDEGAMLFAEVLPECPWVEEIDLTSNLVTSEGDFAKKVLLLNEDLLLKQNVLRF